MGKTMQLVHFSVSLDFAEETRVPSLAEQVSFAIAGAKGAGVTKAPKVGVHMKNDEAKLDVEWKPGGCKIVLEDITSVDQCIETVLSQLNRIDRVAPLGEASSIDVVTHWILPAPSDDFASLERKYREAMIVNRELLWGNASDSSVIVDSKIDDCFFHHQSGAMDPGQLAEEYTVFKLKNVPAVFIFLLTRILDRSMLQYSRGRMRERLTWLLNQSKSHGDAFAQIWEGVL